MLTLIIASVQSILQVMVVVFFGFVLTRAGYFDVDKQRWLSKLNMVFFTPCLLFSNIASVMSLEKLIAFWPIPVYYVVFITISLGVAHAMIWIFRFDEHYRRFVLACILFCNTNSLPIAIISSLAVSEAGKILYWDADDTQESVAARGISYTLFFALFCNILRWSYGYNLLQPPDTDDVVSVGADDPRPRYLQPHYGATSEDEMPGSHSGTSTHRSSDPTDSSSLCSEPHQPQYEHPQPHDIHNHSSLTLISSHPQSLGKLHDEETALLSSFPTLPDEHSPYPTSSSSPFASWTWQEAGRTIHQYMSPPLYAALLALFVGLTPPLKHLLYAPHSFLYPSFTKAVESCGKAAVPIILVSLGAQLTSIQQQQTESRVMIKPIAVAVLTRMVVIPLVIIPIIVAFVRYCASWSAIAGDPVFVVMMIIVGCTPTAINLAQITQTSGMYEEEMMRVLFWSYGVVCVPVCTLIVFIALSIVDSLL